MKHVNLYTYLTLKNQKLSLNKFLNDKNNTLLVAFGLPKQPILKQLKNHKTLTIKQDQQTIYLWYKDDKELPLILSIITIALRFQDLIKSHIEFNELMFKVVQLSLKNYSYNLINDLLNEYYSKHYGYDWDFENDMNFKKRI